MPYPCCTVVQFLFSLTLDASPDGPAFLRGSQGCLTPVLYSWFMRKLKLVVALCGQEPEDFGTHSLRQGGASWALRCGYNSDIIRLLGDWKSDAYQSRGTLSGKVVLCPGFALSPTTVLLADS